MCYKYVAPLEGCLSTLGTGTSNCSLNNVPRAAVYITLLPGGTDKEYCGLTFGINTISHTVVYDHRVLYFHTIQRCQDGHQELVFDNYACFACSCWGTYGFGSIAVQGRGSGNGCGHHGYVNEGRMQPNLAV